MTKILIVKVSALGDIIHALPVLDYLHKVCPGVEIDWVVEEANRELLEGNPLLNRVYTIRTRRWRKQPLAVETRREVSALRKELQQREYDLAFDLQGNLKSGLITWFSGAKRRYGFDRDGVRESLNLLFTSNQVPLRRQDHHISSRSLRIASVPFGKDYAGTQLSTDIYTSSDDDAAAETFLATLSDGLVFLLHHGTTWKTKLWHEPAWIETGKRLLAIYPESTVLLSWGGEAERAGAECIAAGIGSNSRLLPKVSLKEFAAMLKKVDVVIGGDTGPLHMAAAVGTPTVSFYRVTDGKRNGPQGDQHVIIQSPLPCNACLRKECDKDAQCRESITVEAVLDGVERILKG